MKFVILAAVAVCISGTASAASIQLDRVCGNVHVEKVMCIAAPCPAFYFLRTGKGTLHISLKASSKNAVKALDGISEGSKVCINGQYQDAQKSILGAFEVEAAKSTEYVCKQVVNCMPIVAPEEQKYCTDEYVEWSKQNCGGAPQRLD